MDFYATMATVMPIFMLVVRPMFQGVFRDEAGHDLKDRLLAGGILLLFVLAEILSVVVMAGWLMPVDAWENLIVIAFAISLWLYVGCVIRGLGGDST